MRIEVSAVAHAPVDDVWTWWTDYGAPGSVVKIGHGVGVSTRKVIENDGKRVVLEEDMPLPFAKDVKLFRHDVEISDGRWLSERGHAPARYESKWFFEALPGEDATRITRILDVPGRALDFAAPVLEPVARKWALADLQHHVNAFEDERGRA